MTKIKLCGMRREVDIRAANEAHPDFIGFILTQRFRRAVTVPEAAHLHSLLARDIRAVGVFVDEPVSYVRDAYRAGAIDVIQLHGHEDDRYIEALRQEIGTVPVMKAFRIEKEDDAIQAFAAAADAVLLDAGTGTGLTFHWQLLESDRVRYAREHAHIPVFLAGGLTPENVAEGIRVVHPDAVDISSGIETDGWKDPDKMLAFVNAVRKADTHAPASTTTR